MGEGKTEVQPVADETDDENVKIKVVGQCRFRPTKKHKPRKPGETFEGPASLLDRFPDVLEEAEE